MTTNEIYIDTPLKPEQLETILIKAGNDMKWTSEKHNRYKTSYKIEPLEEIRELDSTEIYFFKKSFWKRRIKQIEVGFFPNLSTNFFYINSDSIFFGKANSNEVKQFLKKVGDYMNFFQLLGRIGDYIPKDNNLNFSPKMMHHGLI